MSATGGGIHTSPTLDGPWERIDSMSSQTAADLPSLKAEAGSDAAIAMADRNGYADD